MVPFENIDPIGAAAFRPGVSFLVSNKTIAELIVERGLCPSPEQMNGKSSSANGWRISKAEAMQISALTDGETATADKDLDELGIAVLQTADGHQAWELYHRIGEVLRNFGPPDLSRDFAALLAARLDDEATKGRHPSVTGEGKPTVAPHPPLERTSSIFPDPRQRES